MTRAELQSLSERIARLEAMVALLLRLREPNLNGEQRERAERELKELSGE
jgi:hypothetical protein